MQIRVWVTDVWDAVTVNATPEMTVGAVKASALAQATGQAGGAEGHAVKLRGALVTDERQTLGALHAKDHTPFIVLPARRQPVR